MNRKEFVVSGGAFAALGALGDRVQPYCVQGVPAQPPTDYDLLQREIDAVHAADFYRYLRNFEPAMLQKYAALNRLEDAFDRVLREVRETKVTDRIAVWFLYNMGIVIKTPETCFAVDVSHRRGTELAPLLDFALITHNHDDHFTEAYYKALNGAGKTVISNFKDNYGVKSRKNGGYTRAVKTFMIKDVTIKTALTDHNDYLIDFTSTFEISSRGYTIYHTGDCSNVTKLNPTVQPDLWFVHPYCGMNAEDGAKKFKPKTTVIAHLNELGHDRWRWTWKQGFEAKVKVEAVGGKAIIPTWGTRII